MNDDSKEHLIKRKSVHFDSEKKKEIKETIRNYLNNTITNTNTNDNTKKRLKKVINSETDESETEYSVENSDEQNNTENSDPDEDDRFQSPKHLHDNDKKKENANKYYYSDNYDDELPYGGKVYLARKKKPDSWACIMVQVTKINAQLIKSYFLKTF
jgi:DNA mismatch repair ATPase MutL